MDTGIQPWTRWSFSRTDPDVVCIYTLKMFRKQRSVLYLNSGVKCNTLRHTSVLRVQKKIDWGFKLWTEISFSQIVQAVVCIYILKMFWNCQHRCMLYLSLGTRFKARVFHCVCWFPCCLGHQSSETRVLQCWGPQCSGWNDRMGLWVICL